MPPRRSPPPACTPVLARVFAARGVRDAGRARHRPRHAAAVRAAEGHRARRRRGSPTRSPRGERIVIVADYDADGATACAVGVRGLARDGRRRRLPRAQPVRVRLRPDAGDRRRRRRRGSRACSSPSTTASRATTGVAAAARAGIDVLITDHHLPAATLPAPRADRQSEPAGLRVPGQAPRRRRRDVLRADGDARASCARAARFAGAPEPNLAALLDLVALGTVADVVRLDRVNRTLVAQGLARIRAGRAQPGVAALFAAAGRDARRATVVRPGLRRRAAPQRRRAPRRHDASASAACSPTPRRRRCRSRPSSTACNRERRDVEATMQEEALAAVERDRRRRRRVHAVPVPTPSGTRASSASSRRGSRTASTARRSCSPAAAAASSRDRAARSPASTCATRSTSSPSARRASSPASAVTRSRPGCRSPRPTCRGFAAAVRGGRARAAVAGAARPRRSKPTATSRRASSTSTSRAALRDEVWGQGFPAPVFDDVFDVARPAHRRRAATRKLTLRRADAPSASTAILFGHADPLPRDDPRGLPARRQRVERRARRCSS